MHPPASEAPELNSAIITNSGVGCNSNHERIQKTCGSNYLQPTSKTAVLSFAWSDFPPVYQFLSTPTEVIPRTPKQQPKSQSPPTASFISHQRSHNRHLNKDNNKRVSFSFLEIRSHEIILGDHPCCKNLPLSLGNHHSTDYIDIEVYESHQSHKRRNSNELRLNYLQRVHLLQQTTGLTEQELLSLELRSLFEARNTADPLSSYFANDSTKTPSATSSSKPLPTTASITSEKGFNAPTMKSMRRSSSAIKSLSSLAF